MKFETRKYSPEQGWNDSLPQWDGEKTLIFAFGSPHFSSEADVFEKIRQEYPNSHVVGCSSSGEISGPQVFDESICLAIAQFEHTDLKSVSFDIENAEDSYLVGGKIAEALAADDLASIFVLSDGLCVNGTELIRGLNENKPEHTIVTGGLAGDGDRFEKTWVLADGLPQSGKVSAVGFYGDKIKVGHGSRGGWEEFGPQRTITKAKGNILYELDGQPALDLYKAYLGDKAEGLPATALFFPLALSQNPDSEKLIVRTILSVDEVEKSMTFAGDVVEGWTAQLMRAHFDNLISGAQDAAEMARLPDQDPMLSIAISCVGRRLLLGEKSNDELKSALAAFPGGSQQVGFYSYGEISPYVQGEPCELHNQTMTITTFREEAA